MPLRPYQSDTIASIKSYLESGVNRQLIVWPTGAGKGSLIAWIPDALGMKKGDQLLVTVHRNDLVDQTAKRIRKYNKNLLVAIEQGDRKANKYADVIVASIQSIFRDNRLERFDPDQFKYIFIDEAHIIPGSSQYLKVLKYFRAMKGEDNYDPTKYVFGCTATPERPDGKGLDFVFEEISKAIDLIELMRSGIEYKGTLYTYLADMRVYTCRTEVNLDLIKSRGGDFDLADLERTVNNDIRNQQIVDEYILKGEGLPAICFTVDVQHAKDVAAMFEKNGLKADWVSGDTDPEQRQVLYNKLRNKELSCLASCGVMNVGLDLPEATVALMARPTKSGLLYRQSIGRVLRPFPAPEEIAAGLEYEWRKEYAIIIDFVDVTAKHRLISTPSLFGLKPTFNGKGKKVTDIVKAMDEAREKKKIGSFEQFEHMDAITRFTERVDILAAPETPKEVEHISKLAWMPDNAGYFLPLPEGKCLSITKNQLGHYDVYQSINGVRSYLSNGKDLKDAVGKAETCVSADAMVLLKRDMKWRNDDITDNQYNKIASLNWKLRRQFGTKEDFRAYIKSKFKSKGGASAYISQLISNNG